MFFWKAYLAIGRALRSLVETESQKSERRMREVLNLKVRTVQDLVRCARTWDPDYSLRHSAPSASLMRKHIRMLLARPNIGKVDMYSPVRFEHYEHPEGSVHGYYEVVVRDDLDTWTVLPLMLKLHFEERMYYLITSSQVQGPVYKSSMIEA